MDGEAPHVHSHTGHTGGLLLLRQVVKFMNVATCDAMMVPYNIPLHRASTRKIYLDLLGIAISNKRKFEN